MPAITSEELALVALRETGATLETKEDRQGETHSGWWLDDAYLGPTNDPRYALRVLRGD